MVFFQHLTKLSYVCVYVVCITYVRILVSRINLVSFYKELSLECDFKYFHPYLPKDNVTELKLEKLLILFYCYRGHGAIEARFNRDILM